MAQFTTDTVMLHAMKDKKIDPMPMWLAGSNVRGLLLTAFQAAFVTYLLSILLEKLLPGFVTKSYKIDIFLWTMVVSGVLSAVWQTVVPNAEAHRPLSWKDCVWMGLLLVGAAAIVWHEAGTIGRQVKIIAPLVGLVVFGMSLLVYFDRDDPNP